MLVVLISPHGSIIAYGLRLLSSCLGKAGHRVRMIFSLSRKRSNRSPVDKNGSVIRSDFLTRLSPFAEGPG